MNADAAWRRYVSTVREVIAQRRRRESFCRVDAAEVESDVAATLARIGGIPVDVADREAWIARATLNAFSDRARAEMRRHRIWSRADRNPEAYVDREDADEAVRRSDPGWGAVEPAAEAAVELRDVREAALRAAKGGSRGDLRALRALEARAEGVEYEDIAAYMLTTGVNARKLTERGREILRSAREEGRFVDSKMPKFDAAGATFAPSAEPGRPFATSGPFRYLLFRRWGPGRAAVFCGLNPSTADATRLDPTCRREIDFARRWGCGAYLKINLFGYVATRPSDLKDRIRRGLDATGAADFFAMHALTLGSPYKADRRFGIEFMNRVVLDGTGKPVHRDEGDRPIVRPETRAIVVAAWGADGALQGRADQIRMMARNLDVELKALGFTRAGLPVHPLYQPADATLRPYPWREA